MEAPDQHIHDSEQEIIVVRNRQKQLSVMQIVFYPFVGILAFALLALLIQNLTVKIIVWSVALFLLLEISFVLWRARRSSQVALHALFLNTPILRINHQGFVFIDSQQPATVKGTLIPWSEIARLSFYSFRGTSLVFPYLQGDALTITLKDPEHWWVQYGDGRPRQIPAKRLFAGAHFAFSQNFTATPLFPLLQQIQEVYAHEIQFNEVEIIPFASPIAAHRAK